MVTGQVVQTLLGLLEMAAASAMAAALEEREVRNALCGCCKECELL